MMRAFCTIVALALVWFVEESSVAEEQLKSIYTVQETTIRGQPFALQDLEGSVLLIVNTASRCGYTPQFKGLQALYEKYKKQGLVVIGMPSNQFRQEESTNEKAAKYCELNFGVNFPMLRIRDLAGPEARELAQVLTREVEDESKGSRIQWNFEKFLVSRDGRVVQRFRSSTKPQSLELVQALERLL